MARLGDILVRAGRLSPERADDAARRARDTGQRIGEILLADGVVSSRELLEALAEQWAVPFLEAISDETLDPEMVRRLPVDWARRNRMLPIRHQGAPAILTADPARLEGQESLALMLGFEPLPVLATEAVILSCIDRCYSQRPASPEEALRAMRDSGAEELPLTGAGGEDLLRASESAPVTRLVNLMLLEALGQNASDIHIEPIGDRLRVRYRIDGILADRQAPPKRLEAALTSRLKIMARLDIAESRLPQDGAARVRVGEREIDIRMSTVPVSEGERIVLRLLRRENAGLTLADLGMEPDTADRFRDLIGEPQGILLVTGPTGSGKTTTLYAALKELDTRRLNVMTIEDPIEYRLQAISQIQINPKIDLTFARCLRHVLRQDPDVVLVGEMRDLETAEIAVRASLTGHLVLTTLHTNDAVSAALRMVDMGIEPYLISAALRGILAQRLVRRLCPRCRGPVSSSRAELARAGVQMPGDLPERMDHWVAMGCSECQEGYKGRIGLFELMVVDESFALAVRSGESPPALRRIARSTGMMPLAEDGWRKVLSGQTSAEELVRVVGKDAFH